MCYIFLTSQHDRHWGCGCVLVFLVLAAEFWYSLGAPSDLFALWRGCEELPPPLRWRARPRRLWRCSLGLGDSEAGGVTGHALPSLSLPWPLWQSLELVEWGEQAALFPGVWGGAHRAQGPAGLSPAVTSPPGGLDTNLPPATGPRWGISSVSAGKQTLVERKRHNTEHTKAGDEEVMTWASMLSLAHQGCWSWGKTPLYNVLLKFLLH